jgi:general secretion pathway protein F
MDQVFKLITRQPRPAPAKKLVDEIAAKVSSGALLSDALHQSPVSVPDFVPSLIKAGEARGNLGSALQDIADFLDMQIDLRSSIRSALTYPMILVVAALVVLTIIMTTLVPALMPLFEDAGAEPPVMLTLISEAMSAVVNHAVLLLAGTVAMLGLLFLARGNSRWKRRLDAARLRVPLIGAVQQKTGLVFFAKTLGTLLKSGVPLVAALGISTGVVSNQEMAAAFSKSIEDVKAGRSLTQALKETGLATDTLLGFVEVGENSGKLDEMLLHAAGVLDKEVKENVGRAMSLLTPALTVLIGLAVGGLILSVMQAILSVNDLSVR